MRECKFCGKDNAQASKFCAGCGAKLDPDIDAAVQRAVARKTAGASKRNMAGVVIIAVIALIIFIAVKVADGAENLYSLVESADLRDDFPPGEEAENAAYSESTQVFG
ncbi:MAG: hypothetical protein LBK41_08620 [Clostridiales bacterium]|jgi:uncharacterized membrane protein YvbJ|nr:hypothetical protein [Clostridiales bacterium]